MKRPIVLRLLLAGLLLAALAGPAVAQLNENLLGLSDENLKSYLDPLQVGLSGTLNSAIFRTGFVPETGFELTVGAAAMAIGYSDGDKTYRPVDPVGFTSLEPTDVSTVVGDPAGVVVHGEGGLSRGYPGGFDMEGFEIAVPQASIGCVLGTRALVRYIALDLGDADLGDFKYLGIGGQHSISQWIPSLPIDLAAGAMYQDFKISDDLLRIKAMQVNLTGSRQYGMLQPYLGVGYDTLTLEAHAEDPDHPEDAIDVKLDRKSNMHFTLGLMARLSVIGIFGEFNAGAGTGFALGFDLGTIGGANHAHRDAS